MSRASNLRSTLELSKCQGGNRKCSIRNRDNEKLPKRALPVEQAAPFKTKKQVFEVAGKGSPGKIPPVLYPLRTPASQCLKYL